MIIEYSLSITSVLISLIGLIFSSYTLMSKRLNKGDVCSVVSMCLIGLGWCLCLLDSIDTFNDPRVLHIMSKFLFLYGIVFWVVKSNKLRQERINETKCV